MFADRGQRHPERRGEFADRMASEPEAVQEPAAGRVSQGAEDGVEPMVNHMV